MNALKVQSRQNEKQRNAKGEYDVDFSLKPSTSRLTTAGLQQYQWGDRTDREPGRPADHL